MNGHFAVPFADKQLAAAKAAWQSGDNSRKTGILRA